MLWSLISGGLTGVLGSTLNNLFDFFKKRQEFKQQVALKKLDLDMMDKEWAYRERVAIMEGEVRMGESADKALAASYAADKATYVQASRWLLAVDLVRGLVRPALTVFLIVQVYLLQKDINDMVAMQGGLQALGLDKVMSLYASVVDMILYLASTAVAWWFGSRPPAQGK